jgi:Antibiotic biosynthesis monooxygenase
MTLPRIVSDEWMTARKERRAPGCLDFAITADLIDPGRINVFERWETQEAVRAWRGRVPMGCIWYLGTGLPSRCTPTSRWAWIYGADDDVDTLGVHPAPPCL